MQGSSRLPSKHVVLMGLGHTNAHVLRMWQMKPIPDTSLTCVSDFPIATYSGMLPAALAGQIPPARMEVDLVRLSASAGARLVLEPVIGLNLAERQLLFAERPPVPFDVLSIGIGSVPTAAAESGQAPAVPIKPMQTFVPRLSARLDAVVGKHASERKPLSVLVVGSGVAGIEIVCCMPEFLRSRGVDSFTMGLVTRSSDILPEVQPGTRRRVKRVIEQRHVSLTTGHAVTRIDEGQIWLDDGRAIAADVVIWATGAAAPPALGLLGVPLDAMGFVATERTLRVASGDPIFAVGDSGSMVGQRTAKAGVFAVRQGPVLWDNIRRQLDGRPLRSFYPQSSFLKLINTGDGRAIGQWRGLSFAGRWAYRLKHQIDNRFIDKFQPQEMSTQSAPMQCRGCGCKLAAASLMAGINSGASDGVTLEDAAEIGGGTASLIASTDFFSSPVEDPFLAGRIAALHAASDIVASGGKVTEALANVVLPEGEAASQQRVLSELLAGARAEFSKFHARIVGGHTIVGPRMEVGFTVIGSKLGASSLSKSKLLPGDRLYITKPLGVGVLLAANMRSRCKAAHYQSLLDVMLAPQHKFAQVAVDCGLHACTDVTGFGLIGHLLEMLQASRCMAEIDLGQVPLLPGAEDYVEQGIESSLIDDNWVANGSVDVDAELRQRAAYRLMFDPQTCGGLLFGVPIAREAQFIDRLAQASARGEASCIGEIKPFVADERPLRVVGV